MLLLLALGVIMRAACFSDMKEGLCLSYEVVLELRFSRICRRPSPVGGGGGGGRVWSVHAAQSLAGAGRPRLSRTRDPAPKRLLPLRSGRWFCRKYQISEDLIRISKGSENMQMRPVPLNVLNIAAPHPGLFSMEMYACCKSFRAL